MEQKFRSHPDRAVIVFPELGDPETNWLADQAWNHTKRDTPTPEQLAEFIVKNNLTASDFEREKKKKVAHAQLDIELSDQSRLIRQAVSIVQAFEKLMKHLNKVLNTSFLSPDGRTYSVKMGIELFRKAKEQTAKEDVLKLDGDILNDVFGLDGYILLKKILEYKEALIATKDNYETTVLDPGPLGSSVESCDDLVPDPPSERRTSESAPDTCAR